MLDVKTIKYTSRIVIFVKIKIIDGSPAYNVENEFETLINDFIKDKKIIDIKYMGIFEGPKKNFEKMHYSVLIMYED